ncbi:MAG: 4Fe-4S dicluster domain-containing protein [Candidatus Hadarchaeales archaeon]
MPYVFCDPEKCTGCRTCELVCSGVHEKVFNPKKSRIRVLRREPAIDVALTCRQCADPPCARACPSGAIRRTKTDVVEVDAARCIGCSLCVEACPFGAISIIKGKAAKCDLCGGDPACVKQCMPGALKLTGPSQVAAEKRLAIAQVVRPRSLLR